MPEILSVLFLFLLQTVASSSRMIVCAIICPVHVVHQYKIFPCVCRNVADKLHHAHFFSSQVGASADCLKKVGKGLMQVCTK